MMTIGVESGRWARTFFALPHDGVTLQARLSWLCCAALDEVAELVATERQATGRRRCSRAWDGDHLAAPSLLLCLCRVLATSVNNWKIGYRRISKAN
jgi:hypothetical protein